MTSVIKELARKKKIKTKKRFEDNQILSEAFAFANKVHAIASLPGYSKEAAEKRLSERIALIQSLKIK